MTVTEALQSAGQSKLSLPKKLQCEMNLAVIPRIKGKGFTLRKKIVEGMKKKETEKLCGPDRFWNCFSMLYKMRNLRWEVRDNHEPSQETTGSVRGEAGRTQMTESQWMSLSWGWFDQICFWVDDSEWLQSMDFHRKRQETQEDIRVYLLHHKWNASTKFIWRWPPML